MSSGSPAGGGSYDGQRSMEDETLGTSPRTPGQQSAAGEKGEEMDIDESLLDSPTSDEGKISPRKKRDTLKSTGISSLVESLNLFRAPPPPPPPPPATTAGPSA
jgi:hypothetical protein